jgi:hypothetical protein
MSLSCSVLYCAVTTVRGVEIFPWYEERLVGRCCHVMWRRVVGLSILSICPNSIADRTRYFYARSPQSMVLSTGMRCRICIEERSRDERVSLQRTDPLVLSFACILHLDI